jgi:hypothetical protein
VQTNQLQRVLAKDLAALNAELKRLGMEAVTTEKKPIV